MNSKIFCAIVFIITVNIASAQREDDTLQKNILGKWNVSFTAGFTQNINSDVRDPGVTFNVDAAAIPLKGPGAFLNFSYTGFNSGKEYYTGYYYRERLLNYVQLTSGFRFYSRNQNSFVDAGFGYYDIAGEKGIGVNAGLGGKVALSETYSITLNGRFNAALFEDPLYYFGFYAGVGINDNVKPSPEFKDDKFAVTAYAGTIGNGVADLSDNSFSAELSYKLNDRISFLVNYLYSKSHEDGSTSGPNYYYFESKDEKKTSVAAGMRYFLTRNNVKLFLEGLTGFYSDDYSALYTSQYDNDAYSSRDASSDDYYGFMLGGGVDLLLIDNLSAIIKFDQFILVRGEAYSGLSGGLKYCF